MINNSLYKDQLYLIITFNINIYLNSFLLLSGNTVYIYPLSLLSLYILNYAYLFLICLFILIKMLTKTYDFIRFNIKILIYKELQNIKSYGILSKNFYFYNCFSKRSKLLLFFMSTIAGSRSTASSLEQGFRKWVMSPLGRF